MSARSRFRRVLSPQSRTPCDRTFTDTDISIREVTPWDNRFGIQERRGGGYDGQQRIPRTSAVSSRRNYPKRTQSWILVPIPICRTSWSHSVPDELSLPPDSPVPETSLIPVKYAYDFFLSFSGTDKDLARRAKEQLTNFGYKVCWQDENFQLGRSFMTSMDEASTRSRIVIALLTPSYLATSPHTRTEFEAALHREKLLIFRFDHAVVPDIALTQVYQDFPDELMSAESLATLKRAAEFHPTRMESRVQRVFLDSLPKWQGTEESRKRQALIGRRRELAMLDDALKGERTNMVCVIAGGGFGKSALVKTWLSEQSSKGLGTSSLFTAIRSTGRDFRKARVFRPEPSF